MTQKVQESDVNNLVGGLVNRFRHTLDRKKRLTIPSEWRDVLGLDISNPSQTNYVYVMPNATEECLDLVSVSLMQSIHAQLSDTDVLSNDEGMAYLWQYAEMLKVDAAGRIRIGDELLEAVGIQSKVTLVGNYRKAQIWASEKKPLEEKIDLVAYRQRLAQQRNRQNGELRERG